MRYQAGIQILLVIISLVIIFTVIKQKFTDIQVTQDASSQYQEAISKATEYNDKLQALLYKVNNIPRADMVSLERYVPNEVDPVKVSRDIKNIIADNNLLLLEIDSSADEQVTVSDNSNSFDTTAAPMEVMDPAMDPTNSSFVQSSKLSTDIRNGLISKKFTIKVTGGYEEIKKALGDIERNAYPLQITSLSLEAVPDSILYNYEIELNAYALTNK